MKLILRFYATLMCSLLLLNGYAQEQPWVTSFEEREELNHLLKMSNGNFLLSGKTFEIGNKSDLVILLNNNGQEIKRKVICPVCEVGGNIVYSKETGDSELLYVRSSGDVFASDYELENSRFVMNVKNGEFDFVETYQVLENANFLVVVSYAVKDGVRGLLHTTINTLSERLISNKFNTLFPDISGSIGIGLFNDVGVVDGYNSLENGVSTGHLLRYDIARNLLWDTSLDWGNITLEHVIVTWDQHVIAVGNIVDETDPDHLKGFVVSYDNEGNLLWQKSYDSSYFGDSEFLSPTRNVTKIKQISKEEFVLMGKEGGIKSNQEKGDAFVMRIDTIGEVLEEFSIAAITEDAEAVDVVITPQNELLFLGRAFAANGIAGSFVTIARNVSSVFAPLPDDISIYPNPATDFLVIDDQQNISGLSVRVYNTAGRLVLSKEASNFLSLQGLESGTYYLDIRKGQEHYFHVFVKQ